MSAEGEGGARLRTRGHLGDPRNREKSQYQISDCKEGHELKDLRFKRLNCQVSETE